VSIEAVTKGKITTVAFYEQKARVDQYIRGLGLNAVFLRPGEFYESKYNLFFTLVFLLLTELLF
jgi:hypothetical protein